MEHERRLRRSAQPGVALDLQLAACCEDPTLEAIVVADDEGLLVGAAGDPWIARELAARIPARGASASPLVIDGRAFRVVALGGTETARRAALDRAVVGAARILA